MHVEKFRSTVRVISMIVTSSVAAVLVLTAGASMAQAGPPSGADTVRDQSVQTTLTADLAGSVNPDGLLLLIGGYRRWVHEMNREYKMPSSYLETGASFGVTPAYGQASAYVEWMPAIFATFQVQYTLHRYFGERGALLSFPSKDAKFGKNEVDALKGQEEKATGQRILFQPTFVAKVGATIIRNQTDLSYFRYNGQGPYFLEWEYDTLVKNGDFVVANRTFLLWKIWGGAGEAALLVGPVYEITRASNADLTRQRLGSQVFWSPTDAVGSLHRPRIYAQTGVNREDRNRRGEVYAIIGCGFDLDL